MSGDGDNFTCKYCENEFDSKRGLHIHQSQKHPDEEKQEVEDNYDIKSEESSDSAFSDNGDDLSLEKTKEDFAVDVGAKEDSTVQISLTTRQVAAAALIVGLIIGGLISGLYVYSLVPA